MSKGFYEQFKNKYPVSKTLRFELIPQGKTLEYIQRNGLLEEDENRAKAYKEVKKIIDDYHREHIEASLSGAALKGLMNIIISTMSRLFDRTAKPIG